MNAVIGIEEVGFQRKNPPTGLSGGAYAANRARENLVGIRVEADFNLAARGEVRNLVFGHPGLDFDCIGLDEPKRGTTGGYELAAFNGSFCDFAVERRSDLQITQPGAGAYCSGFGAGLVEFGSHPFVFRNRPLFVELIRTAIVVVLKFQLGFRLEDCGTQQVCALPCKDLRECHPITQVCMNFGNNTRFEGCNGNIPPGQRCGWQFAIPGKRIRTERVDGHVGDACWRRLGGALRGAARRSEGRKGQEHEQTDPGWRREVHRQNPHRACRFRRRQSRKEKPKNETQQKEGMPTAWEVEWLGKHCMKRVFCGMSVVEVWGKKADFNIPEIGQEVNEKGSKKWGSARDRAIFVYFDLIAFEFCRVQGVDHFGIEDVLKGFRGIALAGCVHACYTERHF